MGWGCGAGATAMACGYRERLPCIAMGTNRAAHAKTAGVHVCRQSQGVLQRPRNAAIGYPFIAMVQPPKSATLPVVHGYSVTPVLKMAMP